MTDMRFVCHFAVLAMVGVLIAFMAWKGGKA